MGGMRLRINKRGLAAAVNKKMKVIIKPYLLFARQTGALSPWKQIPPCDFSAPNAAHVTIDKGALRLARVGISNVPVALKNRNFLLSRIRAIEPIQFVRGVNRGGSALKVSR